MGCTISAYATGKPAVGRHTVEARRFVSVTVGDSNLGFDGYGHDQVNMIRKLAAELTSAADWLLEPPSLLDEPEIPVDGAI